MTMHTTHTRPGPKDGPATGPRAGHVPTFAHPVPAEWGRVLLRKDMLKKITLFLDLDSIFNLGRTCRVLNDMVFTPYIDAIQPEKGYYGHNKSIGYLSAPTAHPEGLLTAFRCSLAFHTSLTSIGYGFLPTHGFQGLTRDLSDLRALFQRQPRAMAHLCLYLSQFDHALAGSPPNQFLSEDHQLTPESFREMLCCVLDSAIRKGARLLELDGGCTILETLLAIDHDTGSQPGPFIEAPGVHLGPKNLAENTIHQAALTSTTKTPPDRQPFHGRRSPKIPSLFSRVTMHIRPPSSDCALGAGASIPPAVVRETASPCAGPSIEPQSLSTSPSLQKFCVQTDMLLTPLFLPWTLNLLQTNAGTLKELRFQCSHTPLSAWHAIFSTVPLHRLEKVEIVVSPLPVQQLDIDSDDIIFLLSRCRAVEDLALYGVRPGIPSPRALQDLHSPRLVSFAGHPRDVMWILKLPAIAVPKLGRVVITTESYAGCLKGSFDHTLINDVLDVLDADGRELVLGFSFRVKYGLETWMLERIALGRAPRPLRHIRHLDISFSWYLPPTLSIKELEIVAQFVNTFANIEHVSFDQLKVLPNKKGVGTGDVAATKAFFSKHLLNVKTIRFDRGAEMSLKSDTLKALSKRWLSQGLGSRYKARPALHDASK
ncbi:hypothetical protein BKA70DRAFT_1285377 [Coprinopsis sp. MPI-PUGE-AT-0042]|nr:hypothetical protein BKA70DRAFT_1285377 [Coprinopsis sp. MPI-PUGE-AT-0042]